MGRETKSLFGFNRGLLSKLALARIDLARYAFATEIQNNWMPRVLGSMMFRPGWKYLGSTLLNGLAINVPFVFSSQDTALLELTTNVMRVRVNDNLLVRPAVSTTIDNGAFASDVTPFATTIAPGSIPGGASNDLAMSPDGTILLMGLGGPPRISAYGVSGTTFTAITPPVVTGVIFGTVFSPDGQIVVVTNLGAPLVFSVVGSGASATFVPITAPAVTFAQYSAWSPDGSILAIADTSSQVTLWARNGTTFTALPSPASQAAAGSLGGGGPMAFSPSGKLFSISTAATPFIHTWSVSGTTFTKLANPGTLPTGAGQGLSYSADNSFVAIAHTTTPFVTIYSISGTTLTKIANPGTLPAGNGQDARFDQTGKYLSVGHVTTPFVTIYSYSGTTFTKIANPATLPPGTVFMSAWAPANKFLMLASGTTPFLVIYQVSQWASVDGSGAVSTINNGLSLVGTVYNSARRVQSVSVSSTDRNTLHAVRFVIARGNVTVKIGSAFGASDYLAESVFGPGTYSIAFTPTAGIFYVDLSATTQYASIVTSVQVEGPGTFSLPTIWDSSEIRLVRYAQSADIIFAACTGNKQQEIRRYSQNSWAVVDYLADDGPFRNRASNGITMAPGSLTGDTTLTSSRDFFKAGHVGAIFRLTSIGQTVATSLNGANQFSQPIKITGTGTSRIFSVIRSNTWSGTLTLQRSITDANSWVDTGTTYTTNATTPFNDGLDNQVVYYRIGFKAGDYTSGQADTILSYASGGLTGIARVTSYVSTTQVNIAILTPFGATTATENWYEGSWSDYRGWPSSVALHEGRMCWAGKDNIYLSVSDAYTSYDDTVTGDSGPINRSIGEGPVDNINWLLPLQRLIVGTDGAEKSCRSSSFDEVLTPTNFNIKDASTQGSFDVAAVKIDSYGVFAQKSGSGVFQIALDSTSYSGDYSSKQVDQLCPEVTQPTIVRMEVQRQPDTRIHVVLADGTAAILVFDDVENVTCWVTADSPAAGGFIEDVAILPGNVEDQVYYIVRRTIGGQTVRYLEKWSLETENVGGTITKLMDSHVIYQGAATTTITGLDHLEGQAVCAWGDGKDLGLNQTAPQNNSDIFTVSGGSITIPVACANVVAGLPYDGPAKTVKLAWAAQGGSPLNRRKRAIRLALVMLNTHAQALKIGTEFDKLRSLPRVEGGKVIPPDTIWDEYDFDLMPLNSDWNTDNRLCITARSPRPVTILGATVDLDVNG